MGVGLILSSRVPNNKVLWPVKCLPIPLACVLKKLNRQRLFCEVWSILCMNGLFDITAITLCLRTLAAVFGKFLSPFLAVFAPRDLALHTPGEVRFIQLLFRQIKQRSTYHRIFTLSQVAQTIHSTLQHRSTSIVLLQLL
jgi:hypothetical protein